MVSYASPPNNPAYFSDRSLATSGIFRTEAAPYLRRKWDDYYAAQRYLLCYEKYLPHRIRTLLREEKRRALAAIGRKLRYTHKWLWGEIFSA